MTDVSSTEADPLANNMVANMNAIPILFFFGIILTVAYVLAFLHRTHYQTKKMIRDYIIIATCLFGISLFFDIHWIISSGIILFGFFVLLFRSNKYFYQQ